MKEQHIKIHNIRKHIISLLYLFSKVIFIPYSLYVYTEPFKLSPPLITKQAPVTESSGQGSCHIYPGYHQLHQLEMLLLHY